MKEEITLSQDVDLPPVKILQAGELVCMYEEGKLRYIRYGRTELLRMIYGAVRNNHWLTLRSSIEDEQIIIYEKGFSIDYTATYFQQGLVYKAHFHIEGRPDSSIVFSMKGEALADFQKNRIGLCVHHPIKECSGLEALITRPDGTVYKNKFPTAISPWQPFLEVQQMQWATADNKTVQLFFEGDIFETEDQRNWSDASFKTYSTPQRIPFPVSLQAGDTMQQSVTLIVSSDGLQEPAVTEKRSTEEKIPFPNIGFSRSKNQQPLTNDEAAWLNKIPFHHYRVALSMHEEGWQQLLNTAIEETILLQTKLELAVSFSDNYFAEAGSLIQTLTPKQDFVYSVLLLKQGQHVSSPELLQALYLLVKTALPQVQIGYGTDRFFANLNRQRPGDDTLFDFTSFSLHPQVHATDTRTIFENLQHQADLIETAATFSAGKPVHISPVTWQDRFENNGPDTRHYTETAALWTLISLQQLSQAGSITYCDLLGTAGLLQHVYNEDGSPAGIQPSPLYTSLVRLHLFQPAWIIKKYDGDDALTNGLLLENDQGKRLFFKSPHQNMHAALQK